MGRSPLIKNHEYPFHIYNQVNNREAFPLRIRAVWTIFATELMRMHLVRSLRIHAFVLMPNHYHALVTSPAQSLGDVMKDFAGTVSLAMNSISGRVGHSFRGRYRWTLVEDNRHFATVLKYIYRNPVKAGLSKRCEDYSQSTLQPLIGLRADRLQIHPPMIPGFMAACPDDPFEFLEWLNTPFRNEKAEAAIQRGLRRRRFELSGKLWPKNDNNDPYLARHPVRK